MIALESTNRGDYVQAVVRRRLSRNWHELLEACWNLPIRASNVQIAAEYLASDLLNDSLTLEKKGQRGLYHMTSLVIHLNSFLENIRIVIKRTTKIYVLDSELRNEVNKKYIEYIDGMSDRLTILRNEFAHGYGSVGSSTISRDNVWEGFIAKGFTFQLMNEDHYRGLAPIMSPDASDAITREVQTVFNGFGELLGELEGDVQSLAST